MHNQNYCLYSLVLLLTKNYGGKDMRLWDWNTILPIVLSLVSFCFSIFTYIKAVRHDRKQDTLDSFNRLQNEVFDPLNLMKPPKLREIAKDPQSDEYKRVSGYLARIEHFCVGVDRNIYDKKVVYDLAHGYLDGQQIKSRINPFLERKNQGGDYYTFIPKVLQWMEKRTDKLNRKHSNNTTKARKKRT